MKEEVWVSLETIRDTYPNYTGEWPISNYCERRRKIFTNTTLYVTDRHGPKVWDFCVPDVEEQAKWFKSKEFKRNHSLGRA